MSFYTNVLQYGNSLLVRYVEDGKRLTKRVKYEPTLFDLVRTGEKTGYTTLDGRVVEPHHFDSIREAKDWIADRENQEVVFGNTQYPYCWISDEYPGRVDWDLDQMLVVTIDIEVECENGFPKPEDALEPLLSITVKNHQSKRIVVFGLHEFENSRDDVTYVKCDTEVHLLKEFLAFWEKNVPDIITGWNTEFFDIPYLCNRIKQVFDEDEVKRLSPWRNVFARQVYQMGRTHQIYTIDGISALDYYDLYRKFTYTNQERYTLDYIAYVELGERKDGNPYDTFREWYTNDYQSFIEYNITDVELVDKLEDKMKLIELIVTMAYEAKVNLTDVLGQVRYWDILIYNHLREKNIVIPPKKEHEKTDKYEGAYVKDPLVGMHNWVVSFDLNSLYPHLIMQYNMSPETLVNSGAELEKGMVDKLLSGEVRNNTEYCMTPNGAFFRKDIKGFLPELMEQIYNDRVKYKKLLLQAEQEYEDTKNPALLKDISKYNNIQMAKKISLNSAYGAIGNNWFRYYDLLIATAITTAGQLSIRWIEKALNIHLNKILKTEDIDYVIASDTDSVYITFDALVRKIFGEGPDPRKVVNFLDKLAKEKLEPFIDKSYAALATYVNAYDQRMYMKREVIADKGIWTAKKRYILNVHDSEGVRYKEPKLKMMGIEAVKSSTPAPCRTMIKDGLKLMMNGTEEDVIKFIDDCRAKFKTLPPEEIAFPRTVSNVKKYYNYTDIYVKGTPIHCRGALLFNHYIKKNKLDRKYSLIGNGEKIKFIYLKKPNIIRENVISFIQDFPKELGLDKYIDYDLQFEKSFVEPLKAILDAIGWNVEKTVNLELFFT